MLFLAAMKCGYQEDPPLIKNYGLRIICSLRQDTSRRPRLSKQHSCERAFKTQERDTARHICDVQT
jgi:hypothetical protein